MHGKTLKKTSFQFQRKKMATKTTSTQGDMRKTTTFFYLQFLSKQTYYILPIQDSDYT